MYKRQEFDKPSGSVSGLSNVQFTAFYVPKSTGFIWGIGPIVSFPVANETFGSKKLSVGPSLVFVKVGKKFVYGTVINNAWSVAGPSDAVSYTHLDVYKRQLLPFT